VTEIWKPVTIKPETFYESKIGPVSIWLHYSRNDWYIAEERDENNAVITPLSELRKGYKLSQKEWHRWACGKGNLTVQLLPVLPDRPVVVRPESPFKFPPGSEALFFVLIPIWIRITAGHPNPITLMEVPTVVLSNSWFGDTTSGELCYAMKTRALRDLSLVTIPLFNRVVCPVHIKNNSTSQLDFLRLCVRVEHLITFLSESGGLWTNKVFVTYRGEEQLSQIVFSRTYPDFEKDCKKITDARTPFEKSIVKRSFQVLKELTGF